MIAQLRSEWIKLRSTRLFASLLVAHVLLIVLQIALNIAESGSIDTPSLGTTDSYMDLLSSPSYGMYLALMIGVVVVTNEHRHKTVASLYINQPVRAVVLGAKAVLGTGVGAGIAALGLLVTAAVALPWLALLGIDLDLAHGRYALIVGGSVLVMAVYGLIGVGLAAVLPQAPAAIGAAVGYSLIIESLLVGNIVPHLLRWLPGGAVRVLYGVQTHPGGPVAPAEAALVLVAYGAAFVAFGLYATSRRDVL